MNSTDYIQSMFRDYYSKNFSLSSLFPMIERREFGFASFDGWMVRHRRFKTREELTAFLQNSVPRDAYYSCAYYAYPEAEMEKKGWLGADLIFDIDADHIPTPCGKVHDEWTCGDCDFSGKGIALEKCPKCNGQKFVTRTWPCEVCLNSAKTETIKLLDMLIRDFGFSEKEIRVFFSGHRGYHVHVENEVIKDLDSISRKEIVDYVTGLGLDLAFHGLNDGKALEGPNLKDHSWRGRIAKGMHDFLQNAKGEDLKCAGLHKKIIAAINKNKDALLKSLEGPRTWSAAKGVGFETWKKLAELCVQSRSSKIDTVVTTDVHRLIRLTDTLHGKTGLKKVEFSASSLENFDPFESAVAFRTGTAKLFVYDAPKFRLGGQRFGPFKDQEIELPTAAALLLICKGKAKVLV